MNLLNIISQAKELDKLIVPDSIQKAKVAETIDKVINLDYRQFLLSMVGDAIWVTLKVLAAILIYFVGRWFIRRIQRIMEAGFERRDVDPSLRTFLKNLVKVIFYIMLLLTVIQLLGVNTTSIVALLASAGLAVGMALSGTLQNFAGGVMILMLKPYRVGDYISAQGQSGTVCEIMLFTTRIMTVDNQTIYIPNSAISTAIIDNYSSAETRRVDWTVSISYGDDVDVARAAIKEIIEADERVLKDHDVMVYVAALADSSVNLSVRAWVKNEDYWDVFFAMNERFYKMLPEKGISFPFPQLDVHTKNNE